MTQTRGIMTDCGSAGRMNGAPHLLHSAWSATGCRRVRRFASSVQAPGGCRRGGRGGFLPWCFVGWSPLMAM